MVLIDADITTKMPISRLAEACSFSSGPFSQAFRQTTGTPLSMEDPVPPFRKGDEIDVAHRRR
ncbi:helix-turn-helix transcriptional regulator [Rhizobium sp. A37_96]